MFSVVTTVYAEFIEDHGFFFHRGFLVPQVDGLEIFHSGSWTHGNPPLKGTLSGNMNYESTIPFALSNG